LPLFFAYGSLDSLFRLGSRLDARPCASFKKLLLRNTAPELLQLIETARFFKEYVCYHITAIKEHPKGFTRAFDMPDPLALFLKNIYYIIGYSSDLCSG